DRCGCIWGHTPASDVYTRPRPQNNDAARQRQILPVEQVLRPTLRPHTPANGDAMKPATALSALKVQAVLGPHFQVLEFAASTRASEEAAAAVGCPVAEIAKSLIFRAADGRAVLVIASGVNRVDEKKVRALLGQRIERASPDFVREATGFVIGGVPPV